MAIKNPQDIIKLVTCYEKSRIILTACELNLFTQIKNGVKTADQIAENNNFNFIATERLLDCLVSFTLLDKNKDQYRITENAYLLSAAVPENILPLVSILNDSWNNWSHLTEIIRRGSPDHQRSYVSDKPNTKDFMELMHSLSHKIATETATIYDLNRFRNLLDIGGASGTYTVAFLKKNPKLEATILDLEDVLPFAEERMKSEKLLHRVELVAGDYNNDQLPKGCDLVLLSDIIGQNTHEQNMVLFEKIYQVLPSNGALLIRDYVMDESHTNPPDGVIFSMLMLVENQGVGAYSFTEYKDILQNTGFSQINLIKKGEIKDSLIEAKK